jgi:hypothetical protein
MIQTLRTHDVRKLNWVYDQRGDRLRDEYVGRRHVVVRWKGVRVALQRARLECHGVDHVNGARFSVHWKGVPR